MLKHYGRCRIKHHKILWWKLGNKRYQFTSTHTHTKRTLCKMTGISIPTTYQRQPPTTSPPSDAEQCARARFVCVGVSLANAHPVWRTSHTSWLYLHRFFCCLSNVCWAAGICAANWQLPTRHRPVKCCRLEVSRKLLSISLLFK